MISRLRGQVLEVAAPAMVVDVQGVGYEVLVPDPVLVMNAGLESVELFTRQVFREDGVTLYGFANAYQRRVFDLLTSVSGCGPKISLAAISAMGEYGVTDAIINQDARALTRTPGIGNKVAERIVLELRDKMQEENLRQKAVTRVPAKVEHADELIEALQNLGYKRHEVEAVADAARESSEQVEQQILAALRLLKK